MRTSLAKGRSPASADVSAVARRGIFGGSLHVISLPALFLIVGFVASYHAAVLHHRSQLELLREETHAELEPIRGDLSRQISAAVHLTEGIASLIAIEGEPSPARFQALATELLRRSNTIRNVAIAPDNVVSQVHPLEGNEAVLGLRYAESAAQWPSVQRMMSEKCLVVAGPVPLVQGGVGVIARRPIYVVDPAGSEGMRYWGLTSTVVDFPTLVAESELASVSGSLRLALRGADGLGAEGNVFWGDASVFDDSPVLSDIPLPSGAWQLGGVPKRGWPVFRALESRYLRVGGLASLALTVLLFRLLHLSRTRRLEVVQRSEAEAALRQSETRLLKAQHVARLGFLDWDLETNEIYASDEIYELYGVQRDDAPTTPAVIAKTVHPDDQARVRQQIEGAVQGTWKYDVDHRVLRPDGTVLWVHAQAELMRDASEKPVRLLGTVRDITERKRAEEALRHAYESMEATVAERTRELLIAKDAAESADRIKSAFLATMSHELRTPLNSIIGFSGILSQGLAGPLNAEQQKQLGMVRASSQHLLALINDVLDLSKIEAGQLTLASEPFDAAESLSHVVATMRPLAEKKRLLLVSQIAESVGKMRGDKRRFEQLLLNLLSNAIKFTHEGTITLEAARHENRLTVSVVDTGIGIAADDLPRLFQPFHQIEAGLARRHEGTGLGLTICHRLVSLMDGTLSVESTPGSGSSFRVSLPMGAGSA